MAWMESLVIQFLMLNEISDLWFGYLIRKSDKEGKMNIPAVALSLILKSDAE